MSLVDRVRAGDAAALARALSLIEAGTPEGRAILEGVAPSAGRALILGVTGPPGAGKSTLVDRLVVAYRERSRRVAVLAVDPSSPLTGGAILGDRVRMQGHADDANVFIRSMATRGQLGGVAAATAGAARLLDAAGFDVVIIETVGVGQAEVDIARTARLCIVVVAPGAGDDVQALKAGVMEIAGIFVVNKADRDGADRTAAALQESLALRSSDAPEWTPPILKTVATTGQGIPAVVDAIDRFVTSGVEFKIKTVNSRPDPELDHVGIAVRDGDGVSELFQRLLGVRSETPETVGDHRVRFLGRGAATVELVEALAVDSAVAKFLETRGQGLHHICFRVSNIDAVLARLKALGVRLIDEAPRAGAHGSRIAFLHPASTGGILVELKE